MSTTLSPLYEASSSDHGAYCVISAAIYAIVLGIIVIARGLLTWQHKLPIGWDDASFLVSAIFALVTVAIYPVAVDAGLGKHSSSLDAYHLARYYKLVYAAQITGIAAIGASKISAVLLSQRAVLMKAYYFYPGFAAMITWTIFSLFATAFQCHTPSPWISTPSNCSSRGGLQYTVTIFGIVTDVFLAVWIIRPVMKLNMPRYDRIIVVSLFGTRIIIPCIAVGQLIALNDVIRSNDQPWINLSLALVTQAVVNLSVICSTLPRVNRFLYSLRDNLLFPRISEAELGGFPTEINSIPRASVFAGRASNSVSATRTHGGQRANRIKGWEKVAVREEKNSTSSLCGPEPRESYQTSVEAENPGND